MGKLYKSFAKPFFNAFPGITWKRFGTPNNLYLTFDDGPDPEITPAVLNILREFKVSALFFLRGEMLKQHSAILRDIDYQGHRLGNHGFHHVPLIMKLSQVLKNEILETDRLIEKHFGKRPHLFRPPYGIWGPGLRRHLKLMKKDLVLWSLMSNDFKWEAEKVLGHLKTNVSGGDIIVFHDNKAAQNSIIQVLPEFLDYCRSNGFSFQLL
jgi:peptidoglycan/xylan/chitin deacetylase (PgdA/CDA1 family)